MDVKEAVKAAKTSVAELFGDQIVSDPLLEEVEFDQDSHGWRITIGFLRMPEILRTPQTPAADLLGRFATPRRAYKIVNINDGDQRVVSVKDRELPQ
jgi:hypothetical protein